MCTKRVHLDPIHAHTPVQGQDPVERLTMEMSTSPKAHKAVGPLSLDLDTFRLILEHLPRSELLCMTYTSRFIRKEASRELLVRPVQLLRKKRLLSFCQFALSGDPNKVSYLRTLTIQHIDEALDEEQKNAVVNVFRHCVNLADLRLQWCDLLLIEDPRVPEAVSALPALSKFDVWLYRGEEVDVQHILRRMLSNMKHSLRRLHLPLNLRDDHVPAFLEEVARVHGGVEDFLFDFYHFAAPPGLSLSHVRTLHLVLEGTVPRLADLYAAFPNVRDLHITPYISLPSLAFQDGDPNQPGGALQTESAMWPSLDSLVTTMHVIYALGLFCPVRTLNLSHYERDFHRHIAEVISRLRPRKLTLDLFCDPDWEAPRADHKLFLHNSGKAGVRHLFLKLSYTNLGLRGAEHILRSLRPLLSGGPVELLHVALSQFFHSNDPDEIVAGPPFGSPPPREGAEPTLQVDVEAVARAMAEVCPRLRCVAVTVAYVGHAIWRVDRSDGRVDVLKLDLYEGRRLLEREERRCLEG
ncbi:hypothetical protein OH77DRAFT_365045 [Trametes cingulata]|nr:hypothetical protein OH77DRAFT_365045 [Trametes cingulata]